MSRRVFTPGLSTTIIPGLNTVQSAEVDYFNQCNFCPKPIFHNIQLDNGIVNPTQTQSQRLARAVNYYPGGKIQFGDGNYRITYLGKTEGQPGGIIGPLRNKF